MVKIRAGEFATLEIGSAAAGWTEHAAVVAAHQGHSRSYEPDCYVANGCGLPSLGGHTLRPIERYCDGAVARSGKTAVQGPQNGNPTSAQLCRWYRACGWVTGAHITPEPQGGGAADGRGRVEWYQRRDRCAFDQRAR